MHDPLDFIFSLLGSSGRPPNFSNASDILFFFFANAEDANRRRSYRPYGWMFLYYFPYFGFFWLSWG